MGKKSKLVILVLAAAFSLVGCGKSSNAVPNNHYSTNDFSVHCLNGVEYYIRVVPRIGMMAVKINPNTLLPSTCN